jgi:arginine utilization regulatory protein
LKELAEKLVDIQRSIKSISVKTEGHQASYTFENLLTKNENFIQTKKRAEKLAAFHSPILLFGESGTGKELFVHAIHQASKRCRGPLVAQNCAAIPESLLESILFGTSKGSYTGAVDRPGLFELADGGTLFLDELHAMPMLLQVKLLRVLEDGVVRRVGGSSVQKVDVRVISAMNIDPQKALQEQLLREDLFYRLNVLTFELLPLRQRQEDILFLTDKFIDNFNLQMGKNVTGVNEETAKLFKAHSWPGNVRELKHTVEYMMSVSETEVLSLAHLPPMLKKSITNSPNTSRNLKQQLKLYEKKLIEAAMDESKGNIQKAARILGIPRQTLQYKLKT